MCHQGKQLALRLLQQLRLAVAALDPFRLMRFVKHAALADRLLEQRQQLLGVGRRAGGDRLIAVERQRHRGLSRRARRQADR
jgi:hypothetical protein